ncbi:MAG: sugar phosphate nucleotidyltransferase [Clostridiales bacterium]|nr:sugar phosphate nucleotidyltransferase [Clostridiales bacterium]
MKAVIMAGGEGTRLRPLTCHIPKPMVPIANTPVMEHIINLLKKHNITEIASTLYYMPNHIIDYFQDGKRFGVNMSYFIEETPLGTGGSVLNADKFLDDTFIVISGDAYTNINLEKAINYHKSKGSKATLILKKQNIPIEYGIVITDSDGKIVRFLEKPSWGEVFSDTVNTGIYILEPEVFNYYKKGDNFDFSKDLFPKLLRDNIPMYGYITEEYWCDIGDINSYRQTNFDVIENFYSDTYAKIKDGVYVGHNTIIPENVQIKAPCIIGSNTHIGDNCKIDSYTIIGNNCSIDSYSSIKRSIIWNKVHIGKSVECRGSIICEATKIQDSVHIYESTVIGRDNLIESNCIIKPGVKIWPEKLIPSSTTINRNIIWGTKPQRIKFTENGIEGEVNIEISPEIASLIGSAYASICNKQLPILVCSDGSKAANLIKQSIMAGIISTGLKALNLENEPINVLRYGIRFYKGSAGVYISSSPENQNIIRIHLLNELGANINRKTEKKLDQIFIREDFQRANSHSIGTIINLQNFHELYIQNNINEIKDSSIIRSKKPKILIASKNDRGALLSSILLESLGCNVTVDYNINKFNSIDDYLSYISNQVKDNYILGAIIDSNCEKSILIDNKGKIITSNEYNLLSTYIALKNQEDELIVPYTSTMVIEDIANKFNAKVKRTKSSSSEIMNELLSISDDLTLNIQYILNFDAILSIAYITTFLVSNSIDLNAVIHDLPKLYLKQQEIECAFSERGRIIRQLIEQNNKNIELFEGIKLTSDKGYAIILPDDHRPILKIYIEGYNEEFANEISQDITDRLKRLIINK